MLDRSVIQWAPTHPGVYIFKDDTEIILYVGKAKNIAKRVSQYFAPWSMRKQDMMAQATKLERIQTQTEAEALYLEENLIKNHQPEYNRFLKNNSHYVYIKITNHPYPSIFVTKQKKNDKAQYIWPKNAIHTLRKTIQYCKSYLKRRWCKQTQFRQGNLCTEYYFWQCAWRCVASKADKIAQAGINPETISKAQSDKIIRLLRQFFSGRPDKLQAIIKDDIEHAIATQNFERAIHLRDMYQWLISFSEKQAVVLDTMTDCIIGVSQRISDKIIVCIIIIVEGKVIDIIRTHYSIDIMSHHHIWLAAWMERHTDFDLFDDHGNPRQAQDEEPAVVRWFSSPDKRITLGSIRSRIQDVVDNAVSSYVSSASIDDDVPVINAVLAQLQNDLGLDRLPYHIEAIDVSHIQGWRCSWGLSCLKAWSPYPKWYRHYKLEGNDDYANLCTIVIKRIESSKKWQPLPDLLLIDGGIGQVNAVVTMINQQFPDVMTQLMIVGIAKGEARIQSHIGKQASKKKKIATDTIGEVFVVVDKHGRLVERPCQYTPGEKLFLKARNEAHRFANRYRTKQMNMEWRG